VFCNTEITRWSLGRFAAFLLAKIRSSGNTFSRSLPTLTSSARFHSSVNAI
jgi:hypothetical protein